VEAPRDPAHRESEVTVDTTRVQEQSPTRTVWVDEELLDELSDLTGIAFWALSTAFAGEPKDWALDVVKTAVAENLQGTPEDWQQHMLSWAKENGSGEYRPGYWERYELTYEYNDFLRSIGRLPS
jgi:hypothetical protein